MRDDSFDDLAHFVFYEPDVDGGRQFVGPFPGRRAAMAYIEGGNLPESHECAGALPMLPPADAAVYVDPPGAGMCQSGCGRPSAFVVVTAAGMRTEACSEHAAPYSDDDGFTVAPR